MDDLFDLDSVRDFMLSKGGRVKNHDLVTHFKSFLNDSTKKVNNRQTFKNFVNTLATVKLDESGEKVLVLKKKYRDGSYLDTSAPKKPHSDTQHEFTTPMPKAPPRKSHKSAAKWEQGEDMEEAGAASAPPRRGSKENTLLDVNALYEAVAAGTSGDSGVQAAGLPQCDPEPETLEIAGMPETDRSTDPQGYVQLSGLPASESSTDPRYHSTDPRGGSSDPRDHVDLPDTLNTSSSTDPVEAAPAEPKRVEIHITDSLPSTTASDTSSERDSPFVSETVSLASEASSMKGESSLASETSSMREASPEAQAMPPPPPPSSTMSPDEDVKIPNATPMSVKDRAKHLNKMASETDIHSSTRSNKQERGERRAGEDDSSSVSSVPISMDAAEREWLVTSAAADYHPMAKILLQNPHLAKRKNFMNGFSPLHWAAKHGKPEVIKLLCGTHYVDVNSRSHGGYTALHLAAMHGHEEIIELLVHGYGADPNIRDYSGKKAKQYLPTYASTRAHLGLMKLPKMFTNPRPVTTIVLSGAVTTQARPHSAAAACSDMETISVPSVARPVSAFGSFPVPNPVVDVDVPDSTPAVKFDIGTFDVITPEDVQNVSAPPPPPEGAGGVDHPGTTHPGVTSTVPDLTDTFTESLDGQSDFLAALAHLDASTGNLPVSSDYMDVDQDEQYPPAGDFDREDSPECIEI